MPPLRVFLSYSHVDAAWKDRVSRQLAVLTEEGLLDVWDDRRVRDQRLGFRDTL